MEMRNMEFWVWKHDVDAQHGILSCGSVMEIRSGNPNMRKLDGNARETMCCLWIA